MDTVAQFIVQIGPTVTQIGCGLAAWRLANALKGRVDDHEKRITVLEKLPGRPMLLK